MAKGKKFFTKEKKVIIFDEDSRRDYLLGFSKRKNERRLKAMDDLKKKEKEKLKEVKKKKREEFKEHLRKQREELDALESEEEDKPEDDLSPVDATYDHPQHVVTVTTVCDLDLDADSTNIGHNMGPQEIKSPDKNSVNKEETKTKVFEKKIKKYSKNKNKNNQRKRPKESNSSKTHPKKKRKKNAHLLK